MRRKVEMRMGSEDKWHTRMKA